MSNPFPALTKQISAATLECGMRAPNLSPPKRSLLPLVSKGGWLLSMRVTITVLAGTSCRNGLSHLWMNDVKIQSTLASVMRMAAPDRSLQGGGL